MMDLMFAHILSILSVWPASVPGEATFVNI